MSGYRIPLYFFNFLKWNMGLTFQIPSRMLKCQNGKQRLYVDLFRVCTANGSIIIKRWTISTNFCYIWPKVREYENRKVKANSMVCTSEMGTLTVCSHSNMMHPSHRIPPQITRMLLSPLSPPPAPATTSGLTLPATIETRMIKTQSILHFFSICHAHVLFHIAYAEWWKKSLIYGFSRSGIYF